MDFINLWQIEPSSILNHFNDSIREINEVSDVQLGVVYIIWIVNIVNYDPYYLRIYKLLSFFRRWYHIVQHFHYLIRVKFIQKFTQIIYYVEYQTLISQESIYDLHHGFLKFAVILHIANDCAVILILFHRDAVDGSIVLWPYKVPLCRKTIDSGFILSESLSV